MREYVWELLRGGLHSLLRNKLRSALTMLGVVLGVASVIAMLAVGGGARHEVMARIQRMGLRNVILRSVRPAAEDGEHGDDDGWVLRYGLTFHDAERILATVPGVERARPVKRARKPIGWRSREVEATVSGLEPETLRGLGLAVGGGRSLTPVDERGCARVCLVSGSLESDLGHVGGTVGETLWIGGEPFRVVGRVLGEPTAEPGVIVPFATFLRTFGTVSTVDHSGISECTRVELDELVVQVRPERDVATTALAVRRVLETAHPTADYSLVVPLELLRQEETAQRVFRWVMVLIAGISLLVGGIGIANIMLSTVTERVREIGIRRALGARRRDVLRQFLVETTALSMAGGIAGCLLGGLGTVAIERLTGWRTAIDAQAVLGALALAVGVGVISGTLPARRAAGLDPMVALRRE